MTYRSPDAYAVMAAGYFAVAVLICALLLLAAYAASAGARLRGGRVRSATPDPRRQRGATARLRAGMTSATTRLAFMHRSKPRGGGVPRSVRAQEKPLRP